jgi:hypothetical protein
MKHKKARMFHAKNTPAQAVDISEEDEEVTFSCSISAQPKLSFGQQGRVGPRILDATFSSDWI